MLMDLLGITLEIIIDFVVTAITPDKKITQNRQPLCRLPILYIAFLPNNRKAI